MCLWALQGSGCWKVGGGRGCFRKHVHTYANEAGSPASRLCQTADRARPLRAQPAHVCARAHAHTHTHTHTHTMSLPKVPAQITSDYVIFDINLCVFHVFSLDEHGTNASWETKHIIDTNNTNTPILPGQNTDKCPASANSLLFPVFLILLNL